MIAPDTSGFFSLEAAPKRSGMIDKINSPLPHPFASDKVAARLDRTKEAAREIMERERAARDAKTAKLRAARKAKEAQASGA